jgi:hypothetical protein
MKFTSLLFNQAPVEGGGSPGNIAPSQESSSGSEGRELNPHSIIGSLLGENEEKEGEGLPPEESSTEVQSPETNSEEGEHGEEEQQGEPETDSTKKPSELEALKTQITELQEKLAKAQTPVAAPTETSPLEGVMTQEELDSRIESANKIIIWAEENSDGVTIKNAKGEDVQLDADAVKSYKIAAQRTLQLAPKRAKWISEYQAVHQEARQMYPQIFDASTPEHQFFQQILQTIPALTKFPNYHLMIGDAMVGQEIRLKRWEQMEAKKSGKAPATPAPTKIAPPSPKAPTAKGPAISPKVSQARNNLKNGTVSHTDALALVGGFLN